MILLNNENIDLPLNGNGSDLTFPSGAVRSFVFNYSIYRQTVLSGAMTVIDVGVVTGVFNTNTAEWTIEHSFSGDVRTNGKQWHTFDVDSSDRLVLTTVALTGQQYNNDDSTISYSAFTELVHT
jgi:hypothetical protein